MFFEIEKIAHDRIFLNFPIDKATVEYNFDEKKLGVTELVCDINVIKLDLAAILKNLCCYGNGCQARVLKSFWL